MEHLIMRKLKYGEADMRKEIPISISLALNLIPVFLYIFFRDVVCVSIIILLLSLFTVAFHILTFFVKRISCLNGLSLPYGLTIVFIADSFCYSLCSSVDWVIFIAIAISCVPVILSEILSKSELSVVRKFFSVIFVFIVLSGQFLYLNHSLDRGERQIIETVIIETYANRNRFDSYSFAYFDVYSEKTETVSIYVPKEIYLTHNQGDKLSVVVSDGAFGISYAMLYN